MSHEFTRPSNTIRIFSKLERFWACEFQRGMPPGCLEAMSQYLAWATRLRFVEGKGSLNCWHCSVELVYLLFKTLKLTTSDLCTHAFIGLLCVAASNYGRALRCFVGQSKWCTDESSTWGLTDCAIRYVFETHTVTKSGCRWEGIWLCACSELMIAGKPLAEMRCVIRQEFDFWSTHWKVQRIHVCSRLLKETAALLTLCYPLLT